MFQKITLIGNVGQEPELRYTPNGVPVTNFSLAVTETLSKERVPNCPDGWKESYNGKNWEYTTWVRVACWRGLAESVAAYLEKGRQVFVEGKFSGDIEDGTMNPRVWTGNDGVARCSFEITADTVKFLGARNGGSAPATGQSAPPAEDDGDLPF